MKTGRDTLFARSFELWSRSAFEKKACIIDCNKRLRRYLYQREETRGKFSSLTVWCVRSYLFLQFLARAHVSVIMAAESAISDKNCHARFSCRYIYFDHWISACAISSERADCEKYFTSIEKLNLYRRRYKFFRAQTSPKTSRERRRRKLFFHRSMKIISFNLTSLWQRERNMVINFCREIISRNREISLKAAKTFLTRLTSTRVWTMLCESITAITIRLHLLPRKSQFRIRERIDRDGGMRSATKRR